MSEVRPTTIQRIDITDHQLEILKKALNSSKLSPAAKETLQKQSGFGMCCVCGGIATQRASYDCQGATRIEKYCLPCVEKQFSRVDK